ncbi:hypothetical protein EJ110_NYTH00250 [Nymphaea thermarum]|nr:hypothetical protein EJ110_NYTH00250 [Nymphaea thermarum]
MENEGDRNSEGSILGHRVGKGKLVRDMEIGGMMELDNRDEFPDLGSTDGATQRGGAKCDNSNVHKMKIDSGDKDMQQGEGAAPITPQTRKLQGWASVVAGSQESDFQECPVATVDRSGDEPTVVCPAEAYQKMEEQYRFAVVAGFYGGRLNTGMDYSFKAIAKGMGASFIRADECTMHRDKLGFARVCMDVSLDFKPVPKIIIEAKGNRISQEVLYESRVRFCSASGTTSHYDDACKKKGKAETSGAEEQARSKVQTDSGLRTRLAPDIVDGGSKPNKVEREGNQARKNFNKRGTTGGRDSSQSMPKEGKTEHATERISNPFLSLQQTVTDRLCDHVPPNRFTFAAGVKNFYSDKEKDDSLNIKEGTGQGSDSVSSHNEAIDARQRGTRKSTRIKIIMERYRNYRFVSNVEGTDDVVRVLCVWKEEEIEATSLVVDHNWVGVSFHRLADDKGFVVFGVYLPPRFGERLQSLYKLEAIVSRVEGPVMLIGDFNAMLNNNNKSGSAPLPASCLSFNRFVYACRLKEVQDSNKRFTWSNHTQGQDSVQCKLDWSMVNNDWQTGFGGEGRLKVQTSATSDHSMLLYQTIDIYDDAQGQKPFRFFKPWLMDKEGKVVMLEAWRGEARGCPMMRLLIKFNRLRKALLHWNRHSFGNLNDNITTLQSRIEECREQMEQGVEGAIDEEHRVRKQLSQALLMEEILEVCTAYFRRVLDRNEAQGMLFEGVDSIPKVTDSDNEQLLRPILEEEVYAAMWSLDKDSVAGPYGFPNYFYQECWPMVSADVVKAVKDFFSTGKIVKSINETMICLIPKRENAKKVDDYRPISFCNTIYKIITKVIVNRMRGILRRIINANQAAFSKGQILLTRAEENGYEVHWRELNSSVKDFTSVSHDNPTLDNAMRLGVYKENIQIRDTDDSLVWSGDGKANFRACDILEKCRTKEVKEWWRKKIWNNSTPAKSCWHTYVACEGSVDTLGSNRNGVTINIVRAQTRLGHKIAGLSYIENDLMGCVVIIKDRGSIHEGEMEVLERILRFHKDYGGDHIIVSPIKEWVRKIRQAIEGRRTNAGWTAFLGLFQNRIFVKQGDTTVALGHMIMEHAHDTHDYFAALNV